MTADRIGEFAEQAGLGLLAGAAIESEYHGGADLRSALTAFARLVAADCAAIVAPHEPDLAAAIRARYGL